MSGQNIVYKVYIINYNWVVFDNIMPQKKIIIICSWVSNDMVKSYNLI